MIEQIEFRLLFPNPFQPKSRWPIDPASVADLADDIRANGLIHPPVVRPIEGGLFEIAVGHRRVMACAVARPGAPIRVDVRALSDRQMYDYVIAEGALRLAQAMGKSKKRRGK